MPSHFHSHHSYPSEEACIPARKHAFFNGSNLITASSQKYSRDGKCLLTFTLTTPIPVRELRLDPKPPGDYSNSLSYCFKAVKVLHIYQGMLSDPHQLITKIITAPLLIVIYLQCTFRFIVISQQVLKDGLLSLDSQTAMARLGCVTMVDGGLTNKLPMEQQMTHQLTLI